MTADLFHYPMACSTASRIAAAEADIPLNVVSIDLYTKTLDDGSSFFHINPLGQVATLRGSSGDILTENVAILLWMVRHANVESFSCSPDSETYLPLVQWISFCASELHKHIFWPIFRTDAPAAVKDYARARAPEKLDYLDEHLETRSYLLGEDFSAADAYLTWLLSLARFAGLDVDAYPSVNAYFERVQSRPKVATILSEDMQALMVDRQKNGKRDFADKPRRVLPGVQVISRSVRSAQ